MALAAHQLTVTDLQGNVVPGAHIEVRSEVPGQPLAAVYSDRVGTVALGNPFDTDASGFVRFFVAGGAYQIRAYVGASGAPDYEAPLQRYVGIGLNSERDNIAQRTQRIETSTGTTVMGVDEADDVLIENGVASTYQLCDPALRTRDVKIIDGDSDAATNNITITVPTGKTLYGVLNGTAIVDGNGGSVILTPRADGTGWF